MEQTQYMIDHVDHAVTVYSLNVKLEEQSQHWEDKLTAALASLATSMNSAENKPNTTAFYCRNIS